MMPKRINFRTKSHVKHKSMSVSHHQPQQFVAIQKVLNQYQKKKLHPKIQNFCYMSAQSMGKRPHSKKFLSRKDEESSFSERLFGPMPDIFKSTMNYLSPQKVYDTYQITLASSQQKQTYTKMSKLRNRQKRTRLKVITPQHSERSLQLSNNNLIELLGQHIQCTNKLYDVQGHGLGARHNTESDSARKFNPEKTFLQRQHSYKKYAQIQQFLEDQIQLRLSQKKRITQFKKRCEKQKYQLDSKQNFKKCSKLGKMQNNSSKTDKNQITQQVVFTTKTPIVQMFEEQPINFSNKGWVVTQNNQSALITF